MSYLGVDMGLFLRYLLGGDPLGGGYGSGTPGPGTPGSNSTNIIYTGFGTGPLGSPGTKNVGGTSYPIVPGFTGAPGQGAPVFANNKFQQQVVPSLQKAFPTTAPMPIGPGVLINLTGLTQPQASHAVGIVQQSFTVGTTASAANNQAIINAAKTNSGQVFVLPQGRVLS